MQPIDRIDGNFEIKKCAMQIWKRGNREKWKE